MMRPLFSSVMISLVLVSQVGVPLHYHYCKGALESVSLFFQKECDDHKEVIKLPACCAKFAKKACEHDQKNCCHDQVKVLNQDLKSIAPIIPQWVHLNGISIPVQPLNIEFADTPSPVILQPIWTGSGPPIYIRHHALIFYDC